MSNPEMDAIRKEFSTRPRPKGLAERRLRMNSLAERYPLEPDVELRPLQARGVRAEWVSVPQSDADRIILFIHGGGFSTGSPASHRHMVAQLAREARARTLSIDYRLAPEHRFPAALEDALEAYHFLIAEGYSPQRIALAGEAAGGGLVMALLIWLRDSGEPLPSCAWLASPWVDLTMSGETMQSKAAVDPSTQKPYLEELAKFYLGAADPRSTLASPLFANLVGLPPLLIQVGSSETLLDDSVRLARAAGIADVRVTLEVWPDMMHGFQLFYREVGAARRAIARVGEFIRSVGAA